MSSSNGAKLGGVGTVAAAIGLLITPAPAHALPPVPLAPPDCYRDAAGYQFAGGPVTIHYPETDAETKFNAPRGITVNAAPAETFYANGTSMKGDVSGIIDKGGNWIKLTVTRGKYAPLHLTGAVQPDNTPAGNFVYENNEMQPWDSPTQLVCIPGAPVEDRPIAAPAAPAPAAPANTAPTEAQAPAPQEVASSPEQNQACIPDPFDLNFPGAC